jgi:hypothetical protein
VRFKIVTTDSLFSPGRESRPGLTAIHLIKGESIMKIGVNTWVWTAPCTTSDLEKLAPHVKELGFDWIEVPLESWKMSIKRGSD